MPDLTTLRSLREAVRGAEGADADLGWSILQALGAKEDGQYWWWSDEPHNRRFVVKPNITASVDAALALARRLGFEPHCLEWYDDLETGQARVSAELWDRQNERPAGPGGEGPTEPLAIIDCILSALIARAEAEHAG